MRTTREKIGMDRKLIDLQVRGSTPMERRDRRILVAGTVALMFGLGLLLASLAH